VPLGDPLTIDTPEQVTLEMAVAGIGSRFLAIAVDTLVQLLIVLVAFLLLVVGLGVTTARLLGGNWTAIGPGLAVFVLFLIYWGYFAGFEIAWNGQTPGKRAAGIRVIRQSGRPLDAPAAIIRNLVRVVDLLPGMYGVGVVCMMLTRHSRRLGDLVAGTVVVHDRPAASLGSIFEPPALHAARHSGPIRLPDEELALVERYLERRHEYGPAAQTKMAAQIAGRVTARTGLQPERGEILDDFLARIAARARDVASFR
jgi:uncharacterized RDD family membrane protein YckC